MKVFLAQFIFLLHLNSYVELWISLPGISLSVGPLVSFYFRLLLWRTNAQHFEGKSIKMAKTEDEVVYRFDFPPSFDRQALGLMHASCAKLLINADGHKGAKTALLVTGRGFSQHDNVTKMALDLNSTIADCVLRSEYCLLCP